MANLFYTRGKALFGGLGGDWENDVFRALLVRSTSSYTPDVDDDYLSEFGSGGGVEISVSSYGRVTLGNAAVVVNDDDDQVELDADDIAFGALEAGQTVAGLIVYRQVGGDDTTPENDELIAWIDTDSDTLLPHPLANGPFTFALSASGLLVLS